MCGIVGYLGSHKAQQVLLEGLAKLEYRGYDSAGVALMKGDELLVQKAKGRLANLEAKLDKAEAWDLGIGHTRWATHGEPNDMNSHPHLSMDGTIAVVHNGIIENHKALRQELTEVGIQLQTETDTEVIPNLIAHYYAESKDLKAASLKAINRLQGSFALGILAKDRPEELLAFRQDSPLIVGLAPGEGYIASDVAAVLKYTDQIVYLDNQEGAMITPSGISFFDFSGKALEKDVQTITWSVEQSEKGGYDHFTLKEIHEQPKAIRDTLRGRLHEEEPIELNLDFSKEDLDDIHRIHLVACGTAYHASLAGKKLLEGLLRIPAEAEVASEFRYQDPLLDEHSLVILVSQSGETADTLAVLRDAKAKGATCLAITNVVGSSIARDAHQVIYTQAGPEIGVASTKAYLTQLIALTLLTLYFCQLKGVKEEKVESMKAGLQELADAVSQALDLAPQMKDLANHFLEAKDAYFLGRGLDFVTATEASLKLKELSYIHSESYPGGELKHGPIALMESGTLVVTPITQPKLADKMISNLKEVQTRGALNFVLAMNQDKDLLKEAANTLVELPTCHPLLSPVVAIVPLQLLAYYVSLAKGFDVDKPRNLAKSVTVE